MDKENISVDLDDSVVDFVCSNTDTREDEIRKYINDIVYYVCLEENIICDKICVSISSASKEEIRNINKEYRNIDKSTDVLSFPIFERDELKQISLQKDEKKIKEIELGDIILCLDVVKEQAEEYETGVLRETLYMITHGTCHLVGHDHMVEDEKEKMRALEEKVLGKIGVKRK